MIYIKYFFRYKACVPCLTKENTHCWDNIDILEYE